MPWHVEKRKGEKPWKVVKDSTGAVVGSHPSEQSAKRQIRALHANVKE